MIEREQHRADVHALEIELGAHLIDKRADLVESVTKDPCGMGDVVGHAQLRETIETLVDAIANAIASFVSSDERTTLHSGDLHERDPLVNSIWREASLQESHGISREVIFGIVLGCRRAFDAVCGDGALQSAGECRTLLAACFDRIELGLVSAWQRVPGERGTRKATVGFAGQHGAPSEFEDREPSADRRSAERCKELTSVNEQLRRELDQRMRVEEERELYYRALLHSQKLEAVGALAGGVAHDLGNLFQVVRCNIDLLRARADKSSFAMLEEVGQVTDRAVALVRQLLMFSRKQPMARRILDVGEVVRDLLRLLRRVMPENIRLFSEVEDKLPFVRADVSAIEQLLMNLIINARDSMPRGGTIHVSVCRQRRVPPERIRAATSMQQVAIFVRDVGTGMPQDVLSRIFDPFFTTKSHSSGLGLSVVHGIVEEHGGWVEVTSAMGQGSCFAIYLPGLDESMPRESTTGETDESFVARGERLLLVEDEEVVRKALTRELMRFGYAVQAVGTAEEALTIYHRAPGYFDCVISDGLMPGMSGPEMVLEMLKGNPNQRAIFISGYAPTMDCWQELQSRGFRLLAKPFGTKELVSMLRETLETVNESPAATLRTPQFRDLK